MDGICNRSKSAFQALQQVLLQLLRSTGPVHPWQNQPLKPETGNLRAWVFRDNEEPGYVSYLADKPIPWGKVRFEGAAQFTVTCSGNQ